MDMKTSALAFGIAAAMAGGAYAQLPAMEEATAQGEAPAFSEIDANMDGSITTREAEGTWLAGSFSSVDTNKDGLVDEKEYNEAVS